MATTRPYFKRSRPSQQFKASEFALGGFVDLRSVAPPDFADDRATIRAEAEFERRSAAVIAAAVGALDELRIKPDVIDLKEDRAEERSLSEYKASAAGGSYLATGKCLSLLAYADIAPITRDGMHRETDPSGRDGRGVAVQHLSVAAELLTPPLSEPTTTAIGLAPLDLAAAAGSGRISDHLGISAIVGTRSEASSPVAAKTVSLIAQLPGDPPAPRLVEFTGVRNGELRWLLLRAGSYLLTTNGSILPPLPNTFVQVYKPSNLSRPLHILPPREGEEGFRLASSAADQFVRLSRFAPSGTATISANLEPLHGATQWTSIPLDPWQPSAFLYWPQDHSTNAPIGSRWHELRFDSWPTAPGVAQQITLHAFARTASGDAPARVIFELYADADYATDLANPPRIPVRVETDDTGATPPFAILVEDGPVSMIAVMTSTTGVQEQVAVEFRSDLTGLTVAMFTALDETGSDWPGSDEIAWTVRSDLSTIPAVSGVQQNVHTDPRRMYPMLADMLVFRDSVSIELEELGAGKKTAAHYVLPAANEDPDTDHHQDKRIPDFAGSGLYRATYRWTRRPSIDL